MKSRHHVAVIRQLSFISLAVIVFSSLFASAGIAVPLSAVTLTPSLASPRNAFTPITLTAKATGGTSDVFQFLINGTPVNQTYSATATCVWTPTAAGQYTLTVNAEDLKGTDPTAVITSSAIIYNIVTPLSSVTLTATPANGQLVNQVVILTATVNGGVNDVYTFMDGFGTIASNSAVDSCPWTPTTTGVHTLIVYVTDTESVNSTEAFIAQLSYTVGTPITSVQLSAQQSSPQLVNTPITLNAATTPPGINVSYCFSLVNTNSPNTILQNFSSNSSCTWTPTTAATYTLQVQAEDASGVVVTSSPLTFTIVNPLSAVTMTVNPAATAAQGTPITITATANGGVNLQYQFLYTADPSDASPHWTQIQGYSSLSTCAWTPLPAVGNYQLKVNAEDLNATPSTIVLSAPANPGNYVIADPLTSISLFTSPLPNQLLGSTITLIAAPVGGANLQYQFCVYNPNANPSTSVLQDYLSSFIYNWTPQSTGTYSLYVVAKDLNGNAANPRDIHAGALRYRRFADRGSFDRLTGVTGAREYSDYAHRNNNGRPGPELSVF